MGICEICFGATFKVHIWKHHNIYPQGHSCRLIIYINMYMCVCVRVCACVCMDACMFVCMFVKNFEQQHWPNSVPRRSQNFLHSNSDIHVCSSREFCHCSLTPRAVIFIINSWSETTFLFDDVFQICPWTSNFSYQGKNSLNGPQLISNWIKNLWCMCNLNLRDL